MTGGGDSDSQAKDDTDGHTYTHKAVFCLHTHTHAHLLWGSATVPRGASQAERHVTCLHHLLSGQTQAEGLELTAHRGAAHTHTADRCIKLLNYP